MTSFKDCNGRKWTVVITIGAARRVLADTGIDLLAIAGPGKAAVTDVLADPARFAHVLFDLIRDRAAALGVSQAEFAKALDGPTADAAVASFVDAVADFFPPGPPADPDAAADEDDNPPDLWPRVWSLAGYVGINPDRLTLRELWAMAAGRYDFQLTNIGMIGAALAGKDIPPNPYRVPEVAPAKSDERLAAESAKAWELLERSLRERAADNRR